MGWRKNPPLSWWVEDSDSLFLFLFLLLFQFLFRILILFLFLFLMFKFYFVEESLKFDFCEFIVNCYFHWITGRDGYWDRRGCVRYNASDNTWVDVKFILCYAPFYAIWVHVCDMIDHDHCCSFGDLGVVVGVGVGVREGKRRRRGS